MASIELVNVRKNFGHVEALRGINLKVANGEFLTLLGPSGSGKTTLLNILQGFEHADEGELFIDGEPMSRVPPNARGFGMVFQSYSLFPHMRISENVAYPLRIRGMKRTERNRRVSEVLEKVELTAHIDKYPAQLSGGEQQRVALARALVFRPGVLLMDEPLGALDRRLRQSLQLQLRELHDELEATIIFVTHDQEEALVMSDRIAVMNNGQVLQVGTPTEVYRRPTDTFVAQFLGETNLIPCKVTGASNGSTKVELLGNRCCLTIPVHPAAEQSNEVAAATITAVRPEDVHPKATCEQNAVDRTNGVVASAVYLGDSWRIEVDTNLSQRIVAKTAGPTNDLRKGDHVILEFDCSNVVLLTDNTNRQKANESTSDLVANIADAFTTPITANSGGPSDK